LVNLLITVLIMGPVRLVDIVAIASGLEQRPAVEVELLGVRLYGRGGSGHSIGAVYTVAGLDAHAAARVDSGLSAKNRRRRAAIAKPPLLAGATCEMRSSGGVVNVQPN
jgi:hypothetical protein